jgi:hypothetical protein
MSDWRHEVHPDVNDGDLLKKVKKFQYSHWGMRSTPLVHYLKIYGLRHCKRAAKKQSTSDPSWKSVIDDLIMSQESAFGCMFLCLELVYWDVNARSCLRLEDGQLTLLPSHVFAYLNVSDEHDSVAMQTASRSNKAREYHNILEHMAELGGNFSELPGLTPYRGQPNEFSALQLACIYKHTLAV